MGPHKKHSSRSADDFKSKKRNKSDHGESSREHARSLSTHRQKSPSSEIDDEDGSEEKKDRHQKRDRSLKRAAKKRRCHSSSSDSSTHQNSSSSDDHSKLHSKSSNRKSKKKHRSKRKKKKSHKSKDKKKVLKEEREVSETITIPKTDDSADLIGPSPESMCRSNMKPMTKAEWEKQQSVVKRVYDPETGRHRLIKGDGEVLEEIVSYQKHKEINKMATAGDGAYFQSKLGLNKS